MAAASENFAAESPHFAIRFLIRVMNVSLVNLLTAPDDASSSGSAVVKVAMLS